MSTDIDERLTALAPEEELLRARTDRLRPQVLALALAPSPSARRPRRRLTLVAVGVAAAVVASLVVGTSLFLGRGTPQDRFEDAAPDAAYETYGAFSIGSTLFIGNRQVGLDDKVKALYYTSEGVVVRTGASDAADDDGPSRYTLVTPGGKRLDLDLTLGDVVPATDPRSPYLVFASPGDSKNRWGLTRYDLRTFTGSPDTEPTPPPGQEEEPNNETEISGSFTWGGWDAPPVATAGDRVWVLLDAGWTEWDAATGAVRAVPRAKGQQTPLAAGGTRYVVTTTVGDQGAERDAVRDFVTGETVGQIPFRATSPMDSPVTAELSPEGGFARYDESYAVYDDKNRLLLPHQDAKLLDLATGQKTPLASGDWGWTPDGGALRVQPSKGEVTVCRGDTGQCESIERDLPDGTVRVGGRYYGT